MNPMMRITEHVLIKGIPLVNRLLRRYRHFRDVGIESGFAALTIERLLDANKNVEFWLTT